MSRSFHLDARTSPTRPRILIASSNTFVARGVAEEQVLGADSPVAHATRLE